MKLHAMNIVLSFYFYCMRMYDCTAQIVGLEGGHSVPRVSSSQGRKLLVLVYTPGSEESHALVPNETTPVRNQTLPT